MELLYWKIGQTNNKKYIGLKKEGYIFKFLIHVYK